MSCSHKGLSLISHANRDFVNWITQLYHITHQRNNRDDVISCHTRHFFFPQVKLSSFIKRTCERGPVETQTHPQDDIFVRFQLMEKVSASAEINKFITLERLTSVGNICNLKLSGNCPILLFLRLYLWFWAELEFALHRTY